VAVIRNTRKGNTILETSINQEEEDMMMMKATAVAVVVAEAAVEVEVVAEEKVAEVKVVAEVEEEMTIMKTTMIMEMKIEVLLLVLNQKSQKEDNQNLREVVVKEVAARKLEKEVAARNPEVAEVDLRLLVLWLEELHWELVVF
jgi:hypothetical protein